MSGENTKNYQKQGGAENVIGGKLTATATATVDLSASTNIIVLPAADPHIVGALWNNAGTITISAG